MRNLNKHFLILAVLAMLSVASGCDEAGADDASGNPGNDGVTRPLAGELGAPCDCGGDCTCGCADGEACDCGGGGGDDGACGCGGGGACGCGGGGGGMMGGSGACGCGGGHRAH